jgi:polyhydroxybutyrate depolymerase
VRALFIVAAAATLSACDGETTAHGPAADAVAVDVAPDAAADATADVASDTTPDVTAGDDGAGDAPSDSVAPPVDAADGSDAAPDVTGPEDALDAAPSDADSAGDADTAADAPDTQAPVMPTSIGGERPAVVYTPDDYDPDAEWPLVVLLHGFSANGFVQNLYLGLSTRTTEDGFVLVVPNGTENPDGNLFWNATDYCCDFYGQGVDDVAYVESLIDEASGIWNIDSKRVYLIGHSNGGFMSYRMACDAPDRITAIVSIAGATFSDEAKCQGTTPVAVLQVHGTDDETIAYQGAPGYPSAEESVSRWVDRDGCDPTGVDGGVLDLDDQVGGAETQVTRWSSCDAGTSVELWTMNGSSHIPAFPATFAERALEFLLAHTRE